MAVIGVAAYLSMIAFLRFTGKRTLSKMNAFDLVVTVALGSTLATVLLSSEVSLSEGLLALALLCFLQYLIAFMSVRSSGFRSFVKSQPRLILANGRIVEAALRDERLTVEEVHAALRSQGFGDVSQVDAVILETDGSISVLANTVPGTDGTLKFVMK